MAIPVIDIFAGPGGLGEGFSALTNENGTRKFKIALSIEKEPFAHQTLTLRSFFRQFEVGQVPTDYYKMMRGEISLEELYNRWPEQSKAAKEEAILAKLGTEEDCISHEEVDEKIRKVLGNDRNWLLIGGPPCQAYSVVGRSRRQEKILDEKKDVRVELYKQYLRILAIHSPAVFVMENVKGILSAETKESPVFSKILKDLADPAIAYNSDEQYIQNDLVCPGYRIYSIVKKPKNYDDNGNPIYDHSDYIIHAEEYGVPQTRHRVILLGIRVDINIHPTPIETEKVVPISKVLQGLPRLRSSLSKTKDSFEAWKSIIEQTKNTIATKTLSEDIIQEIEHNKNSIQPFKYNSGKNFIATEEINSNYKPSWFLDKKIEGICNHSARGHMMSDIQRYFFVSCYGKVKQISPKLAEFPAELLPKHENVMEGVENKKFADRFRVQLWNKPAKTITSHISKDGHYYIHPDPTQCRSLTVREAARIQTFPDNYFFCGPRTAQFIQVGNAVPPILAFAIAHKIQKLF